MKICKEENHFISCLIKAACMEYIKLTNSNYISMLFNIKLKIQKHLGDWKRVTTEKQKSEMERGVTEDYLF